METSDDLTSLAIKHGTDKWGAHFYTPHYHRYFNHLRKSSINILEIGVGGYESPNTGGQSLRMWKEYFPYGNVFAIDIYDKKQLEEERISIFRGSQIDRTFLEEVCSKIGKIDVIIDDGSHLNNHIVETFRILFPLLSSTGVYVVEDIQTSYWNAFGGDSMNLRNRKTAINYFKSLVDSLNHEEFDNPWYKPTDLDKTIVGIEFVHNMVFIRKGSNNEGSNIIRSNRASTQRPLLANCRYIVRKAMSFLPF